jgi:hypothetical protein
MLKLYARDNEKNKKPPARIIFYRGISWPSILFFSEIYSHFYQDGVSEAEFQQVLNRGM